MNLTPSLTWPNRNTQCITVHLCDMTLHYSYETLVGARIPGEGSFQTAQRYSNTTSRHLRDHDIAWCQKISQHELEARVNRHALEWFQHQLLNKFVGEF